MTSLDAVLAYRPVVLTGLQSFLRQQRRNSPDSLGWQADVAERLQPFTTAGKLLRGCLVCYSYALCSEQTSPLPAAVVNTAVALELAHAALLIHDDIIDQDELRRGQPSIYKQYKDMVHKPRLTEAAHIGESLALCAGDMALLWAFELLGSVQTELSSDEQPSQLFARALTTVTAGQMQDIDLAVKPGCPSKQAIYDMIRDKTASYSLALPLTAGALLAKQSAAKRQHWQALGLAAGTIFQIRDDELGVFGQADKLGKPVGSDIREGKKTLLYYYLWQASSSQERQRWQMIFGNPSATPTDINSIRQAMLHYKVSAHLQSDIRRLERTAQRHIDQLGLSSSARNELQELVAFCAQRES